MMPIKKKDLYGEKKDCYFWLQRVNTEDHDIFSRRDKEAHLLIVW